MELHFTYDEEFGGELGPGWLLKHGLTQPDLLIAAGFSYEVVTAHNGCLQMEVTVHGKMAHAAIPESGVDAMQAAVNILSALYQQNTLYKQISSEVAGINHPYLNVGMIEGGTNTNVVPGRVTFKLDRRMIPEENPAEVEATLRQIITDTAAQHSGVTVDIKRMLLANAMRPLPGNKPLVDGWFPTGDVATSHLPWEPQNRSGGRFVTRNEIDYPIELGAITGDGGSIVCISSVTAGAPNTWSTTVMGSGRALSHARTSAVSNCSKPRRATSDSSSSRSRKCR